MLKTSDWSVIALTIAAILLLMAYPFISDNILSAAYYSLILQSATAMIASVFCFTTALTYPKGNALKTVWTIFGAGSLSWFIGNFIFSAYILVNNGAEPPFPYFSDIGFLGWILLAIIGFYFFTKSLPIQTPLWGMMAAATVFAIAVMSFYLMGMFGGEGLELVMSAIYSILPPAMIAFAIVAFSCLFGGRMATLWLIMVFGATAYFLAHFIYIFEATGGTYQTGRSFVDIFVSIAFLLITVASMIAYNQLTKKSA